MSPVRASFNNVFGVTSETIAGHEFSRVRSHGERPLDDSGLIVGMRRTHYTPPVEHRSTSESPQAREVGASWAWTVIISAERNISAVPQVQNSSERETVPMSQIKVILLDASLVTAPGVAQPQSDNEYKPAPKQTSTASGQENLTQANVKPSHWRKRSAQTP